MTFAGWLFLGFGWGVIIILTVFCFYKLFAPKKKKEV